MPTAFSASDEEITHADVGSFELALRKDGIWQRKIPGGRRKKRGMIATFPLEPRDATTPAPNTASPSLLTDHPARPAREIIYDSPAAQARSCAIKQGDIVGISPQATGMLLCCVVTPVAGSGQKCAQDKILPKGIKGFIMYDAPSI